MQMKLISTQMLSKISGGDSGDGVTATITPDINPTMLDIRYAGYEDSLPEWELGCNIVIFAPITFMENPTFIIQG